MWWLKCHLYLLCRFSLADTNQIAILRHWPGCVVIELARMWSSQLAAGQICLAVSVTSRYNEFHFKWSRGARLIWHRLHLHSHSPFHSLLNSAIAQGGAALIVQCYPVLICHFLLTHTVCVASVVLCADEWIYAKSVMYWLGLCVVADRWM